MKRCTKDSVDFRTFSTKKIIKTFDKKEDLLYKYNCKITSM